MLAKNDDAVSTRGPSRLLREQALLPQKQHSADCWELCSYENSATLISRVTSDISSSAPAVSPVVPPSRRTIT